MSVSVPPTTEEQPGSRRAGHVRLFCLSRARQTISLGERHAAAFWYVVTVIIPAVLRTGRRPVIFSRYAGMGDILCTFPAALELKKRHPNVRFIYNCAANAACLPPMGGVTSQVTTLRHIGLVGFWYRFLLSGFYNFGSDDDDLSADHSEIFIKGYGRRHGVTVEAEHPRLQIRPAALAGAKSILTRHGLPGGPLILIHTGPAWAVKQWPHESWVALVRELKGRGFAKVVQLGTGIRNYANIGASDTFVVPDVVSLVDQLTLEECIALISLADLFVGVDSGLLHIAASVRTPAVGIWGPTTPQFLFSAAECRSFVTSPVECQGCHHRVPRLHWMTNCPVDIKCMKAIQVDEVLQACLSRLAPANATPPA